jgi:hypothetical protein
MLLEFLKDSVFGEKFDGDDRLPEVFFELPWIGQCGLIGLDPLFWGQLTFLILLQSVVNLACALLIYKVIVPQPGTTSAYLLGYGIICPALIVLPFLCIRIFDLRNSAMMIAAAAGPTLLFWRNFEAMYATMPSFATQSMGSFVMYYCSTVQFDFDASTQKVLPVTRASLLRKSITFIWLFVQTSLLFSLLRPVNYEIFPQERTWFNLFSWKNLVNNYILAFLTSMSLEVGSVGIGLAISVLTGIETMDLNINPLTSSQSPSDFWGNRWNRLVSSALKRGVFIPLRKAGLSRPMAAMGTFLASGLLHEYIILVIAYNDIRETGRMPVSGSHLLFFAWSGAILGIEHFLRRFEWVDKISQRLPPPVRTFIAIMTVLPLSHLFTQVYVDLGFYTGFSMGFPRIVRV